MKKTYILAMVLLGTMANVRVIHAEDTLEPVRKACVEALRSNLAPSVDVAERVLVYSAHGGANDDSMRTLYTQIHIPDAEVKNLLSLSASDGSFTDIDYDNQDRGQWKPALHNTRLCALTMLYVSPESSWYHDEVLGRRIHKGLEFWFSKNPECVNWWHNRIGTPKTVGRTLLMLRDELSAAEMEGGLKVLDKAELGMTGQNKCWVAEANLLKGLLYDDAGLVKTARDAIAEEIFISDGEGLKNDWSFHQHGHQLQFGNYGLSFLGTVAFWTRVLSGTEYDFGQEKSDMVASYLSKGVGRCFWKGAMDPSACARQLFMDAPEGKCVAMSFAAMNMAAVGDARSKEFRNMARANLQPQKYANKLVGASYYPCSDFGIYRTRDWYASCRMHSSSVQGFEFTNRENMNGWFSADGAVLVMRTGKEYVNIFPYWDWRKLPGTTTYEDGRPLPEEMVWKKMCNATSHVGGLASDDILCTTMELCRGGLHALKSVFYFKDMVVNLGTDIYVRKGDFSRITTALGQCHLNGDVQSGDNWAYHDGVGYVLLDGSGLKVSSDVQSGDWGRQDPGYGVLMAEGPVFKCWTEHPVDANSTYAYALLPCWNRSGTEKFASGRGSDLRILRNDKCCQAVSHDGETCIVFHEPGSLTVGGRTVKADMPCIMMLKAGLDMEIPETQW